MSEDQDSKLIQTKVEKHTVKIRTYTTGGDEEALKETTTAAMRVNVEGEGDDAKATTAVDASVETKLDRMKVSLFVLEVDGKTERMVERIYTFRSPDFHQVLDEINKVTNELNLSADTKKKS